MTQIHTLSCRTVSFKMAVALSMCSLLFVTSASSSPSVLEDTTSLYFKKGGAGGGLCGDLDDGPGGLNVSWWYDWGHSRNGFKQCNGTSPIRAEYVPMIWGKWALANTTQLIADLAENAPGARYIFGFNEPDHTGSYLKPADAAARWGNMEIVAEALNLTIVSPCVSNYDSGLWWLNEFRDNFRNATGREPRMDHMCVHAYYNDGAAKAMMAMVTAVYHDYKRPVWVNEFACPPYKNCTSSHQMAFMKETLPLLEASPYVFRYAWFVSRDNRPPPKGDDSLHVINQTELTPLGTYYRDFLPVLPPPPPVPPAPPVPPSPSPPPSPPPRPPPPPPGPSPSPHNCSVAGRIPLSSTKNKFCYNLCASECHESVCDKYFVMVKQTKIPCLYTAPAAGDKKGHCNEDKSCIPHKMPVL
eukprot:m.130949 g.130949  ORF g.130949 m.130949 type:complete len:414 (+) comp17475_c0_seq22:99-1340(+)